MDDVFFPVGFVTLAIYWGSVLALVFRDKRPATADGRRARQLAFSPRPANTFRFLRYLWTTKAAEGDLASFALILVARVAFIGFLVAFVGSFVQAF